MVEADKVTVEADWVETAGTELQVLCKAEDKTKTLWNKAYLERDLERDIVRSRSLQSKSHLPLYTIPEVSQIREAADLAGIAVQRKFASKAYLK